MIKLKQLLNEAKGLLNEITDWDFNFDQLRKDNKDGNKVKAALNKAGIRGLDVRGPIKHTTALENNPNFTETMFVHFQYRYIKGKDGKTYFIHESQYWLSDFHNMPKINLTSLHVKEAPSYPESTANRDEKHIGNALVYTDKWLNAVKKVETLSRG